jgi:hypothetical protein
VLVFLLLLPGCFKPVNVKKGFDVGPDEFQSLIVSPPKSDQIVNVVVRSPDVPVDVYVVLGENEEKLDQQVASLMKRPRDPLETKTQVSNESFDVKIPANKAFAIVMHNKNPPQRKSAHVELEVVSK